MGSSIGGVLGERDASSIHLIHTIELEVSSLGDAICPSRLDERYSHLVG